LPLQMGVHVVAVASPLQDDVRRKLKIIGALPESKVSPAAYDAALTKDAAPFDRLPDAVFNSDPALAAIVPTAGHVGGSGPVLILDPAQNNTFKAINR